MQQGHTTFISDTAEFVVNTEGVVNETAARLAITGEMDIAVEDGTDAPDRPNVYVEAYMPVIDAEGTVEGVVEVYVDVTGLASALHEKFNLLSILLTSLMKRTKKANGGNATFFSCLYLDARVVHFP